MSESNEGIVVSGGSFVASQVVVGRNSQAIQTIYRSAHELEANGHAEVARAIADLLQALEAQKAEALPDREEVIGALQQVAAEVKKEQPSKLTLKSLLNGISETVTPIADILQKVVTLKTAVATLLGLAAL